MKSLIKIIALLLAFMGMLLLIGWFLPEREIFIYTQEINCAAHDVQLELGATDSMYLWLVFENKQGLNTRRKGESLYWLQGSDTFAISEKIPSAENQQWSWSIQFLRHPRETLSTFWSWEESSGGCQITLSAQLEHKTWWQRLRYLIWPIPMPIDFEQSLKSLSDRIDIKQNLQHDITELSNIVE